MNKYQEIAQILDANAIQDTVDAYVKGRADAECEYTYKVMQRIAEVDADFISIDHLVEVLEDCKEQK